jgi:type IV pilus assembly protein PilA
MRGEGVSVTRGEAPVLVVMEEPKSTPDASHSMELILSKRISDGYESVLRLALRTQQDTPERGLKEMQVWMRFESGSWRIVQIMAAPSEALVNFEDDKLVSEFRESRSSANESSAVGSVRTYNTAAVTYAATYEDLGYPANLEVLGGDGPGESTAQHSRLVDSQLSTSPYIKSGYRFEYHPSDLSPIATYTITARPVQYGSTGNRSFFSDETGVIRFTTEDREPTAADPPLK